jgi:hypothetical protein
MNLFSLSPSIRFGADTKSVSTRKAVPLKTQNNGKDTVQKVKVLYGTSFTNGLEVNQGFSKVATSDQILASYGHVTCYNVIVLNLEKQTAYMAHIWGDLHDGFSPSQQRDLEKFNGALGKKVAMIVEGSRSSGYLGSELELKKLGIDVLDIIHLKNEPGTRWGIVFNPKTRQINAMDHKSKQLYVGCPFPDFVEPPPEESGLSDEQRIRLKLTPFVDPKTGELSQRGQERLSQLLDETRYDETQQRSDLINNILRSSFIAKRAKDAGFKDIDSYVEADPNNLCDISPGSLELVFRKLQGNEAFLQRCKKANHSISITLDKIMELFKDYPDILIQLADQLGRHKD